MKCEIILGLSVIIVLSVNVGAEECIEQVAAQTSLQQCKDHWKRLGRNVSNDTSQESRDGEMHCFTKCIYEKMGIFYDGQFHTDMIRDYVDNNVHHPFGRYFLLVATMAAELVNKDGGSDCQKADDFWDNNNHDPLKIFKHLIFCEKDPWLNPE